MHKFDKTIIEMIFIDTLVSSSCDSISSSFIPILARALFPGSVSRLLIINFAGFGLRLSLIQRREMIRLYENTAAFPEAWIFLLVFDF